MNIKYKLFFSIFVLIINLHIIAAEENDYGIVKAWFNEKNATMETVEDVRLKIGEPSEVKIEVISKIKGHVIIALTEPGVTKAFKILNGPSEEGKRIDNLNINSGWSKTYIWTLAPNGAWKNANAPINLFIKFYDTKAKKEKTVQFTIANPYILDEQYTGAAAITTPAPEITGTDTPAKPAPFPSVIFVFMALIMWRFRRGTKA